MQRGRAYDSNSNALLSTKSYELALDVILTAETKAAAEPAAAAAADCLTVLENIRRMRPAAEYRSVWHCCLMYVST